MLYHTKKYGLQCSGVISGVDFALYHNETALEQLSPTTPDVNVAIRLEVLGLDLFS